MKKMSLTNWLNATRTWHLIYLRTKKNEKFVHGSGFEDIMITDEAGSVVNPFGYCSEFMQNRSNDEEYYSSRDRCCMCPLFPTYCGYDSIDGSAENSFLWRYVDSMREHRQDAAIYYAEKIFREILFQCQNPILARICGINIKKICKKMKK